MNRKLFERIQELFFEALNEKNGWGKERVKEVYRECTIIAMSELIDQS